MRELKFHFVDTNPGDRVVYPDPRWFAARAARQATTPEPDQRSAVAERNREGQKVHQRDTDLVVAWLNERLNKLGALQWKIFRTCDLTCGMPRRITRVMPDGRLDWIVGQWLRSKKFRRSPGHRENFWSRRRLKLTPRELSRFYKSPSNRKIPDRASIVRTHIDCAPKCSKAIVGTSQEMALLAFWKASAAEWRSRTYREVALIGRDTEPAPTTPRRPLQRDYGASPSLSVFDFAGDVGHRVMARHL